MRYYSPSTGGFHDDAIARIIPPDAVDVSDDEYASLLASQSEGRRINAGPSGRPVAAERAYAGDEHAALLQHLALAALGKSDITVLRCVENAVPVPAAWRAYRKDLRAIVSETSPAKSLPVIPDYPEGT